MPPFSEACERNKGPILDVLRECLASHIHVLEIGSGTGQHAVHFSAHLPGITWYPTERIEHVAELAARIRQEGSTNLRPPEVLDVSRGTWPGRQFDAVFTANTLHIMSWVEVQSLFLGVGSMLTPGGVLCIYGPFRYDGTFTSTSNRDFDHMLRERDPLSGIRDLIELKLLAARTSMTLTYDHDLPAFNRLLIFTKALPQ